MRITDLLMALAVSIATCIALAQRYPVVEEAPGPTAKVFVGQSLDEAKRAMSGRAVEFHEGGFAFAKGDPDESNLIVIVDKTHTYACVWYSKSKSQVTRLSMVFRPHRTATKPEQSWLPATELVLHEDQSYFVRFKPPLTDEEIKRLEQNQPPAQYPPRR